MKRPFAFSLLILTAGQAQGYCEHTPSTLNCLEYVSNYDGDTVTVNIPGVLPFFGEGAVIRIGGIDTPEMKGGGVCEKRVAIEAKQLVAQKLAGAADIQLQKIEKGKYFRVVGELLADGQSIRELLIDNRLAVPYDGGTKPAINWCEFGSQPSNVAMPGRTCSFVSRATGSTYYPNGHSQFSAVANSAGSRCFATEADAKAAGLHRTRAE